MAKRKKTAKRGNNDFNKKTWQHVEKTFPKKENAAKRGKTLKTHHNAKKNDFNKKENVAKRG